MQYRLKGIKEDISLLCESLVEIRGSLRYIKSCPNVINTRTASILFANVGKTVIHIDNIIHLTGKLRNGCIYSEPVKGDDADGYIF